MAGAEAGFAGAAAAIRAIKASGTLVQLDASEFQRLLNQNPQGLVVHTPGIFTRSHRYLMSFKGLAFYTKSREELMLPIGCQLVEAKRMWTP